MDISIFKEKKCNDFRICIIPNGKNNIGLGKDKNYAIISYLSKKDVEKLGELAFMMLNQCDENIVEEIEVKWSKKWFNLPSDKQVLEKYNLISFNFTENKYYLELYRREGKGFYISTNEEEWTKHCFETKPTEKELGEMILELFERKEKEEGIE